MPSLIVTLTVQLVALFVLAGLLTLPVRQLRATTSR
jgi:hypothetical protein